MESHRAVVSNLVIAFFYFVGPRAAAMGCEDLFRPTTPAQASLTVAKPLEIKTRFWNLKANAKLNLLDQTIAEVANPRSPDDFESAIDKAGLLFSNLGNQANGRLDAFITAVFSHAREYPDTSFARNAVHALIHQTSQAKYVVEQIYLRLKNEKRKKTSYALAASIFSYGRIAQDAILRDTIKSLGRSETLTDTELQNLLLLTTHLVRSGMETQVRAMNDTPHFSHDESLLYSHYWTHFFEMGDLALLPKLSNEETKALIAAVRKAVAGKKLNPESRKAYLITMAFTYGNELPLPLKTEIVNLVKPTLAHEPELFDDSVTADLWFTYRLIHTHRR